MGNTIVGGALTGIVIYLTDVILTPYTSSSELMNMFKFILQGMIVTAFVKSMIVYSKKQSFLGSRAAADD